MGYNPVERERGILAAAPAENCRLLHCLVKWSGDSTQHVILVIAVIWPLFHYFPTLTHYEEDSRPEY
jgi:hypothetical protein